MPLNCFCYIYSTIPLLHKFQVSSQLLWLYSSVCVGNSKERFYRDMSQISLDEIDAWLGICGKLKFHNSDKSIKIVTRCQNNFLELNMGFEKQFLCFLKVFYHKKSWNLGFRPFTTLIRPAQIQLETVSSR